MSPSSPASSKKRRSSGGKEAESPAAATPAAPPQGDSERKRKRKSVESPAADAATPAEASPAASSPAALDSEKKKKRKSGAKALEASFDAAAASPSVKAVPVSSAQEPLPVEELSELLQAAESVDHAAVEAALAGKAKEVNQTNRGGYTALHLASAAGAADIVELLLKHKAEPNVQTRFGQTALHLASLAAGPAESANRCIGLLLEAGADAHLEDGSGSDASRVPGITALQLARKCGGRTAVIEALQKATESKSNGTHTPKKRQRPLPESADAIWQLLSTRTAVKSK